MTAAFANLYNKWNLAKPAGGQTTVTKTLAPIVIGGIEVGAWIYSALGLGTGVVVGDAIIKHTNSDVDGDTNIIAVPHGNSYNSMRTTWVYELFKLGTGETMKYGITSQQPPEKRYPQGIYTFFGVKMRPIQQYETRWQARIHEMTLCTSYVAVNGRLPPMSFRC